MREAKIRGEMAGRGQGGHEENARGGAKKGE